VRDLVLMELAEILTGAALTSLNLDRIGVSFCHRQFWYDGEISGKFTVGGH
jgi:hypothetical protein